MSTETGIKRVQSVLTDQMPKLNQACDEVAAHAQASVLRAVAAVQAISQQFVALDHAVDELEKLAALGTNLPPDTPVTLEVVEMAPPTVVLGGKLYDVLPGGQLKAQGEPFPPTEGRDEDGDTPSQD